MPRRIPVLIVGGGPVGLALAAELGFHGVACELVEQTDGAIVTPKMNEVNVRTMEFCRRWGVADQVLDCPFPADYPLDVVFVTSLNDFESRANSTMSGGNDFIAKPFLFMELAVKALVFILRSRIDLPRPAAVAA